MVTKDILRQLLRRIAATELCTKESLATELGVGADVVDDLLDKLKDLELINEVEPECVGSCTRCDIKSLCHAKHHGRIWMLTEAGKAQIG